MAKCSTVLRSQIFSPHSAVFSKKLTKGRRLGELAHVHILFELARTVSVSEAVEEVKKSFSKWIKTQGHEFASFAWQAGYGAFAISESNLPAVRDYVANQTEHHRRKSFQEEYRAFLDRHRVAFDERYVWD